MKEPILPYDTTSDYRLIIDLPLEVKKRLVAIKNDLDLTQPGIPIAGGQSLIYLAGFSQKASRESETVDALSRIAMGYMPFKVHLRHFGQSGMNEIFVVVEDRKPFEILLAQLQKINRFFPDAVFNMLPRVTLAKNLQPFQLMRNWKRYEKEHFSATFVVNHMVLLKRMEGFSSWQILKRMVFENLVIEPLL